MSISMEKDMAKKNLCPRTANLAAPEKQLASKDIWHFEDCNSKSLCGSPSRRNTSSLTGCNCPKCQQILARQKTVHDALFKTTEMDNTQYCSFCGARHRLPPYRLHMEAQGQDVDISLCSVCKKTILDRIKELEERK